MQVPNLAFLIDCQCKICKEFNRNRRVHMKVAPNLSKEPTQIWTKKRLNHKGSIWCTRRHWVSEKNTLCLFLSSVFRMTDYLSNCRILNSWLPTNSISFVNQMDTLQDWTLVLLWNWLTRRNLEILSLIWLLPLNLLWVPRFFNKT